MSYDVSMPITKKKPPMTEAEFLKAFRAERNISQRQLAAMLGKPASYIAHTERGQIKNSYTLFKGIMPMLTKAEKEQVLEVFYANIRRELGIQ